MRASTRILLVGAGRWGHRIARNLHSLRLGPHCIVDLKEELAKKLALMYSSKYFTSLDDAIDKCKPDAAIVAVTPVNLLQVSLALVERGIHVLVEKPVAFKASDVEYLKNIAARRKVIVVPGFIMRFNPAIMWLKNNIDMNSVLEAYFYRLSQRPEHIKSTPLVYDLSIHDLDLALWFFGDVKVVKSLIVKTPIDEYIYIALSTNKTIINVITSGLSPIKYRLIRLITEESLIEVDTDNLMVTLKTSWGHRDIVKVRGEEPLKAEIKAFISRIEGKTAEKLLEYQPSIEDAIRVLRVVEDVLNTAHSHVLQSNRAL